MGERVRSTVLTLWIWTTLVVGVVAGFCVLLPLRLLTWPFDPTARITGTLFRRIARTLARVSGLWHFRALPPYPARLDGPHVVVSNHESHLDAFLISFLPYEMKWLAKSSLFRLPFIGWNMALAGDIKVVRGQGSSVQRAMEQCRHRLAQGMHVFLFPEGTRATQSTMLPFKDGAFRLALLAHCPVLPLAVAGTARGLRKNTLRFFPSEAAVKVGTPVSVEPWLAKIADPADAMTLSQATQELKEAVHTQVARMRDELRTTLGLRDG